MKKLYKKIIITLYHKLKLDRNEVYIELNNLLKTYDLTKNLKNKGEGDRHLYMRKIKTYLDKLFLGDENFYINEKIAKRMVEVLKKSYEADIKINNLNLDKYREDVENKENIVNTFKKELHNLINGKLINNNISKKDYSVLKSLINNMDTSVIFE